MAIYSLSLVEKNDTWFVVVEIGWNFSVSRFVSEKELGSGEDAEGVFFDGIASLLVGCKECTGGLVYNIDGTFRTGIVFNEISGILIYILYNPIFGRDEISRSCEVLRTRSGRSTRKLRRT
jgi:hypothetical protein